MDTTQAAQEFLAKQNRITAINAEISNYNQAYSFDDLGSAGMQVSGVLDHYNELGAERGKLVDEMKQLRAEAGDESLLSELEGMEGSEAAKEYIHTLRGLEDKKEEVREFRPPVKKGLFGRFR